MTRVLLGYQYHTKNLLCNKLLRARLLNWIVTIEKCLLAQKSYFPARIVACK